LEYINAKYTYKSRNKNYIYYTCYNRKNYYGSGKIDIKKKTFIIAIPCNKNINHNYIDYEEFCKLIKDGKIKELDFKNKKIQKYFIYHSIYNNNTSKMLLLKKFLRND